MKSLKEYIEESQTVRVEKAQEFKEWDMEGERPARSLSLTSDNFISISSRIDLALEHIKIGYFSRLSYNIDNMPVITINFYNRPSESELNLVVSALKEQPELSKFKIDIKYGWPEKIPVVSIENLNVS